MEKKQKASILALAVKWWVDPDAVASLRSAVATDKLAFNCLASSVGVDGLAMSRETTKPTGDGEDQHVTSKVMVRISM